MTKPLLQNQIQFNNKTSHNKPLMLKKTQFSSLIYKSWPGL
ncbi:hypothetical protein SLEP1_g18910 [Rubroshorea leprosula]|uniref:Uncharacterized protein n=1 Tax=Rubroshorea leprosula TaxID=152421 RepID=A0AAV5J805_9ROSI|nr:hypothetical protein SLEP1_g18910 [Rubroshorea leprosula]